MQHLQIDRRSDVVTALIGGLQVTQPGSPRHPAHGRTQRDGQLPWVHRPLVGAMRNVSAPITETPTITPATVDGEATTPPRVMGAPEDVAVHKYPASTVTSGTRGRPRRAAHLIAQGSWEENDGKFESVDNS